MGVMLPLISLVEVAGGVGVRSAGGQREEGREGITRLRVQAALGEAERELQRLVDARVTVTEVLAGLPLAFMESVDSAVTGAGATVPRRE